MKLLHLTDIHSKKSLIKSISEDLKQVDIVLISGDITHFGRGEETNEIITEIEKFNTAIYAVPGNCDYAEVNQYLNDRDKSLDKISMEFGDATLIGMGGSLPCPGTTPTEYPEEIFTIELNKVYDSVKSDIKSLILLIHQPPVNTINDRVKVGLHVGSKAVREFIEEKQPLLVLSGHIHEGRGVGEIGITKIVNPGAFREGNYALIDVQGSELTINLKKI